MATKTLKDNVVRKQNTGEQIVVWTLFAILLIYAISMIAILGWGAMNSLKSNNDFRYGNDGANNMLGLPILNADVYDNSIEAFFRFENYKIFFQDFKITDNGHKETYMIFFGTKEYTSHVDAGFGTMLVNSLLFAGGSAVVGVLVRAVMGYMCAKYAYKFSKVIYATMIVVMALPIVGAYPGEIALLRDLGLYDNWVGNFIQKFSFTGMYFLVFFEYFKGMPDTYKDAAEIDGASQWTVMTQIYMPLAITIIGSVFLIFFVQWWNDYSTIRMYMRTHPTLSYGIYYNTIHIPKMSGGVPVQLASCMVLALPVLILFLCFKSKIMGCMTLGGIKE